MKIWFDTEFIEDGRTIELISIGMVREDGATYYAQNEDCDLSRASGWVAQNVIPHLDEKWIPRWAIANDVVKFAGDEPEFWAYFADYDWVALCQLYGRMIDLPKGWPMFCLDVQQWAYLSRLPRKDLPEMLGTAHNALDDAFWCRDVWEVLQS